MYLRKLLLAAVSAGTMMLAGPSFAATELTVQRFFGACDADWGSNTDVSKAVGECGIITSLIKGDVFNWGQIMTGALLGAAPPLIIYAFLMDYYIAGLTAGATKG